LFDLNHPVGSDIPNRERARMAAELEFPLMGTTAHVVVVAPSDRIARAATHRARDRLHDLEVRWSSSNASGDVVLINNAAGTPVTVAPETLALVERAVEGWRRTGGGFDPIAGASSGAGCESITIDRTAGTVQLPVGATFDASGIGRGFAVDIVACELASGRLGGVSVSVGGDRRVEGDASDGGGWIVDLEHPLTGRSLSQLRLHNAAVASTWRMHRVWGPPPALENQLVDARTGVPATTGLAGVTVLTGRAWWAHVLATAAYLEGPVGGAALLTAHQASGFLVENDGQVHAAGLAQRFAA
jgi:FAD:protein FMN transferase